MVVFGTLRDQEKEERATNTETQGQISDISIRIIQVAAVLWGSLERDIFVPHGAQLTIRVHVQGRSRHEELMKPHNWCRFAKCSIHVPLINWWEDVGDGRDKETSAALSEYYFGREPRWAERRRPKTFGKPRRGLHQIWWARNQ
jgi:hypothetical protein